MGATFPYFLLPFAIFKVLAERESWEQVRWFWSGVNCPLWGPPYEVRSATQHCAGFSCTTWVRRHPSAFQTGSSLRSLPFRRASVRQAVPGNKGGWVGWGWEGVPRRPIWIGAPRRSQRERTYVNRRHSKGIKGALHWFVLEAVLLICLPTHESTGPVFPLMWTMALQACINWMYVTPAEWRAFGRVFDHFIS